MTAITAHLGGKAGETSISTFARKREHGSMITERKTAAEAGAGPAERLAMAREPGDERGTARVDKAEAAQRQTGPRPAQHQDGL
ncbi:hypothetical protein [Bosea sp. (in: a-proteobacteria)]|uniref:hypothetical protein n=1 Tax=Bosea sp. (in: a-proteobacteria) TaxID=1871050 RepID=UPI0025BA7ACA|nr:hypothetical protein [Bosea sp. (in: a-proteobacteria)]MBR3194188.1 hypothetical protein [Bosea sp. (in: a-proteobacteria)]